MKEKPEQQKLPDPNIKEAAKSKRKIIMIALLAAGLLCAMLAVAVTVIIIVLFRLNNSVSTSDNATITPNVTIIGK